MAGLIIWLVKSASACKGVTVYDCNRVILGYCINSVVVFCYNIHNFITYSFLTFCCIELRMCRSSLSPIKLNKDVRPPQFAILEISLVSIFVCVKVKFVIDRAEYNACLRSYVNYGQSQSPSLALRPILRPVLTSGLNLAEPKDTITQALDSICAHEVQSFLAEMKLPTSCKSCLLYFSVQEPVHRRAEEREGRCQKVTSHSQGKHSMIFL